MSIEKIGPAPSPGEGEAPVANPRLQSVIAMLERVNGPTDSVRIYAHEAKSIIEALSRSTPATPEGLREALTDLHTIAGWLDGLASCPDLNDVAADGGVTVGMCYQQEAREFAGRFRRVLAALAREARDE